MAKHRAPSPSTEPVALGAAVVTLVQAALGALVALNVIDLTTEQTAAVMAAVTALVVVVGGVLVRARTTPAVDVVARVDPAGGARIVAGPASELPTGAAVAVQQA